MRFLYAVTLGRETVDLMASVPHMKRATQRAEVDARSKIEQISTAPRQPRDRVLLMTVYGCGLRISEAIAVLAVFLLHVVSGAPVPGGLKSLCRRPGTRAPTPTPRWTSAQRIALRF